MGIIFDWAAVLVEHVCGSMKLSKAASELGVSRESLVKVHESGLLPLFRSRGTPGDGKPGWKGYRMAIPVFTILKGAIDWGRSHPSRDGIDPGISANPAPGPEADSRTTGNHQPHPNSSFDPIWDQHGKPPAPAAVPTVGPPAGKPTCPCLGARAPRATRRRGKSASTFKRWRLARRPGRAR
jgi:hypothetical protein